LAGFLSGICIIIGRLLASIPDTQVGEIFDFLSPFFALFLTIALYLKQRAESGVLGGVAFIVLFIGLTTLVSLDYYGAFIRIHLPDAIIEQIEEGSSAPVFVGSLFTFLIGEILFGVSVMRAGVYPKIPAVLFMVGLLPVALHPTGIFSESVVTLGATAVGIALIWWGVSLFSQADSERERSIT
jgi:hypothetical protein